MKKSIIVACLGYSLTALAVTPQVTITEDGKYRYVKSNGYPKTHGQFPNSGNPNRISPQQYNFRVTLYPQKSTQITQVNHSDFGVALDGIPFDPNSAEYWQRDRRSGWNYEALSSFVHLGLDSNHAHVQPNGAYHYHGLPTALFAALRSQKSNSMILLGYAADGFPIYGLYGYQEPNDPNSKLIELKSSYVLKPNNRPSSPGPGGRYDGRFVEDYQYVFNKQLDECNGRSGVTPEYPNGTYYYVITNDFPFVPRCFKGMPDSSFQKRPPSGMMMPGNGQSFGQHPPPQMGNQRRPHHHPHPPRF